MEDMKKHREEELRELANEGRGALSWVKLSEPLEVSKDPDYGLVFELWDALSDEALISFENKLENKLLNYRV